MLFGIGIANFESSRAFHTQPVDEDRGSDLPVTSPVLQLLRAEPPQLPFAGLRVERWRNCSIPVERMPCE
jgi:hypothetical protein